MKKFLIITAILIGICVGLYFVLRTPDKLTPQNFEFMKVEKGDIVQKVTATGTIQPINVISVGTQVSGIIEKVYVDYNDEVSKDQLLADIDKTLLTETLNETKARLDLAVSKKKVADLNYNRYNDLYKQKLIAKAEMEQAEIDQVSAESELHSAQASYNKAQQNLDYAKIISPVSGTVISKEVEQGQTVAASFQTPTLFKIAENLALMQIEASVSEADIGKVRPSMDAEFTVDAYPTRTFKGVVRQIRLNPTETQNVVMYTVVIEVANDDKKLLPGMTAFVTMTVDQRQSVLRIPNTTIQFKPNAYLRQHISGERPSPSSTQAVVYRFTDGSIEPILIDTGLSDVTYCEVTKGLKQGDQIISEYITAPKKR